MDDNPYESPASVGVPRETRGTRWAIWSGITCLAVAVICAVLAVVGIISTFQTIAEAPTPKAQDLAAGIRNAMIPAYGTVPFGLLGIILLIVGFAVRRPIDE
jgi:Mn2+/Fe2+ NRAMP family transporter